MCAGVAEIVGALGVPHNPFSALLVAQGGDGAAEPRRLYGAAAGHLHAMRPDTLIVFTTDHYNLFFDVSVPIFAIGVAESTSGPSDYPMLPHYEIAVDAVLAKQIQTAVVDDGFDVGMSQEFELDHTITAPLGVMIPRMDVALVPLWISTSMRPIPSAQRCHALGRAIRHAVERSPLERRVAVVASGAFSFEVGGPRMSEDSHVGVPDPEWALRVTELLAAGDVDDAPQRNDARPARRGRECERRDPQLDRDARNRRRRRAAVHRGPDSRGPRVRRVECQVSVYAVDKVCRRVVCEPGFADRLREDPESALRAATPPLSDSERELLLAGDVGRLGRMGANFFLLHQLGRFELLGLTLASYADRIRAEYRSERAG